MVLGRISRVVALVLGSMLLAGNAEAQSFGSSFTYQGRLVAGGVPVDGTVDLEFRLFTTSTDLDGQVGLTVVQNGVLVVAGEMVTSVDFGIGVFDGQERYLQISVRSPAGSAEPYVNLEPRQRVSPAPYALMAHSLVPGNNFAIGAGTNPHTPLTFATSMGAKISLYGNATHQYGMGVQDSKFQLYTDSSAADFVFGHGSSTNFTERMRIEGTGNVGIGTSTPGTKLDVVGTGRFTGFQLTGNGAAAGRILSSNAQGLASWVAPPAAPWAVNGSNISFNGGNVGIGTTTPSAPLSFAQTTGAKLNFYGSATTQYGIGIGPGQMQYYTDTNISDHVFGYFTGGSFTERARINSAGTGIFNGELVVLGGAVRKGGVPTATSDLGLYSLNSGAWLRLVSNNAPIQFFTNSTVGASAAPAANTAAMTVSPNGNVGIGISSPLSKLNVVGTIRYASEVNPALANTFEITSGSAIDLFGNTDIYMNSRGGRKHILLNADAGAGNVGIGTNNPAEKLHVNGNIRANVIIIDGGADLAESYDVASLDGLKPVPGMVVSIDPDQIGKLRISTHAYDRTVAGIISGADGIAPGLVLGQKGTVADGEHPIANAGRVWCYVDADLGGPVVPGDMLTTSTTPGHAMKASDAARATGSTMGKAMSRLESGRGLVLVLVSLQ